MFIVYLSVYNETCDPHPPQAVISCQPLHATSDPPMIDAVAEFLDDVYKLYLNKPAIAGFKFRLQCIYVSR